MHASIVNLGDYNGFSASLQAFPWILLILFMSAWSYPHVGMELSARRHLSPRGPESRCRLDGSTIGLLALGPLWCVWWLALTKWGSGRPGPDHHDRLVRKRGIARQSG
jgi:hypothetical protein